MGIEASLRKLIVKGTIIGGLLLSGSACSEASKPILATNTAPAASAAIANSPTQEATKTATVTETATLKATEVLAIDQERFHKLPASYEAFLANPEAFIKSPYNPIDNPVEFKKWLDGPLSQALGDPSTREINVWGDLSSSGYLDLDMPKPEIVKGQPEFFWYQLKDGTKVPVILLNIGAIMPVEGNIVFNGTLAIALDGSEGNFNGTDALQAIAEGKPIEQIWMMIMETQDFPDFFNQMVQAGFTGQENDSQLRFGAGWIRVKQ